MPETSRWERRAFMVLATLALVYAFLAAFATVGDPDFGWQLARGRWMAHHHQIFSNDVLSYTVAGAPAVYPAFGGILLYYLYVLGGYTLLSWICGLTCAGTTALLLRRGNAATAAIAILTVPFLAMRSVPRSELLAIPIFAAYVSLLWENYQTGRARLWLLPVLMVAWVNVHFSFFSGFGLLAAFGGMEVLELPFAGERRRNAWRRLKRDIPYFLATAAATLINPWGWKIYKETAQYTGVALAIYVNEWAPLHWNWSSSFTLRNTNDLSHVLLLIIVVAIVVALLQRRFGPALLLMTALYEVTQHLRYMGLASCMLVVVAGAILFSAMPWVRAQLASPRLRAVLATAAVVFFAAIALVRASDVVSNYHYLAERNLSTFGPGLSGWFPRRASEFIRSQNLPDQVFNTYDEGGYTLWALGPERRDYVDGREIPFGAEFLKHTGDLVTTSLDSDIWRREADRYGINTIIFPLMLDEVPLERLNSDCNSKEWRPVYLDEDAIVLVRRTPQNEELIRRLQIDCATVQLPRQPLPPSAATFHQWLNAARVLLALNRNAEALDAADKAMAIYPNNAHARWYRGQVLNASQRDSEAEEDWKRAIALAPREVTPWGSLREFQSVVWSSLAELYTRQMRVSDATHALHEVIRLTPDPMRKANAMVDLGMIYHTTGRDSDAEKQWVGALALDSNQGVVWLALADIYQKEARWPEAIHAYQQGIRLTTDAKTKSQSLVKLARLYFRSGQPKQALQALDDAAHDAPPDLAAAKDGRSFSFDVAQGRAVVWSSLGDLKQATLFEEEAVKLDPEAPDAWSRLAKLYARQGREADQQRAELKSKELSKGSETN